MTTEYAYDPELPYAVVDSRGAVVGRLANERDVWEWVGRDLSLKGVDTTPKPKIPEDADYVTFVRPDYSEPVVAARYGHPGNKVWIVTGFEIRVDEDTLLAVIGDAEVTVLVPKETS